MTDAINTHNRPRNTGVSADSGAGSAAKTSQQDAQAKSDAAANTESSVVELNSTAQIQQLSEQVKKLPEVNAARVEAIKQALGNGVYQPDAEVIARKFNEIENLLP